MTKQMGVVKGESPNFADLENLHPEPCVRYCRDGPLVVPTIGFKHHYAFVIPLLQQNRRRIVLVNVTSHPTVVRVVRQIIDTFPWDEVPKYVILDRNAIYGMAVIRRV